MDEYALHDTPNAAASASTIPPDVTARWVVFRVESGRYALPLAAVVRIIRAAQVTPLPLAPGVILGAIDVAGDILPVFNLRQRFRLRERALDPANHFLLARTGRRTVALLIDAAIGVFEYPIDAVVEADSLAADLAHVRGVLRLDDGMVVIQDLEAFLSPTSPSRSISRSLSRKLRRRMPTDAAPQSLWPRLSDLIAEKTGLHFPPERHTDLQRGLSEAAAGSGFASSAHYADWLLSTPLTHSELDRLANHLTIGETYFFRDPKMFAALAEHVLPKLIGRRRRGRAALASVERGVQHGRRALLARHAHPSTHSGLARLEHLHPRNRHQRTLSREGSGGQLRRMVVS